MVAEDKAEYQPKEGHSKVSNVIPDHPVGQ